MCFGTTCIVALVMCHLTSFVGRGDKYSEPGLSPGSHVPSPKEVPQIPSHHSSVLVCTVKTATVAQPAHSHDSFRNQTKSKHETTCTCSNSPIERDLVSIFTVIPLPYLGGMEGMFIVVG